MMTAQWTVNAIKDHMRAAGSHWFDPDTMRFFGTRILPTVYQGPGGIYFVTSEQPPYGGRKHSVREFDPANDDINTVGEVASMTRSQAVAMARNKAAAGSVEVDATETNEPFNPVSVLEQFLADLRKHGDPETHEAVAKSLIMHAKRHHKMMEAACNGAELYDQDEEPLPMLRNLRGMIEANAKAAGCKGVIFSGDPRGRTVKLTFADGETNDFGKEGWCVPTE